MENRRKCIIVDIDGTVALMGKDQEGRRGPYDWSRVGEDEVNEPVAALVRILMSTRMRMPWEPFDIIYTSGRKEQCRGLTWAWLYRHRLAPSDFSAGGVLLFMRGDNDNRPDHEVKLEILEQKIWPRWEPMFVLDDRDEVVKMWRAQGITCLQVAEGKF